MLEQYKPSLWRQILRKNFTKISELANFLQLSEIQRERLLLKSHFPLNLPLRLAEKIVKGTLDDPILKQFVPLTDELKEADGFGKNPTGDVECRKSDRLLHKYKSRVLLVCTSACAMHCRYCFRQHFDYASPDKLFEEELKLIENDITINEIVLSGGDPLSLDNEVLRQFLKKVSTIPHIRKVRFHTRFPIGIPERIDEGFLNLLESIPVQFWFVIHVNHPLELDKDVLKVMKSIQKLGIPILNHSVLLKGVNDHVDIMKELCSLLVDNGISPYYLNQLDKVEGSSHFEVDEQLGKMIIDELYTLLPGYAVPTYAKDISGMPSKTRIL